VQWGGDDVAMGDFAMDSIQTDVEWRRHYARVYPRIAGTFHRLVDRYGFDMVVGIFSSAMPTYFAPREREERHRLALREARCPPKS
jgi:hypothetical protein